MINLSKINFTRAEYKLLGYNLNFIPTPNSINKTDLLRDIKQFDRRIKLHDNFGDTPMQKLIFKSTSTWVPKDTHHTVQTFLEDFSRKVETELKTGTPRAGKNKNLSKEELEAMNNLKSMDNVIITKADKGGAIVVQVVQNYIKEADRQLRDESFYKKVTKNPTSEHAALVSNAIDGLKHRKLIDEKTAEGLKPTNPSTPKLYLLPKIHKKDNPGRPVVSSVGCHTEKISAFVDFYLQPMNKELESYVQDTTDLNTFLTLILTLNNFIFNDEHYVQINGCSMGTKCAPPMQACIWAGLRIYTYY